VARDHITISKTKGWIYFAFIEIDYYSYFLDICTTLITCTDKIHFIKFGEKATNELIIILILFKEKSAVVQASNYT
jgi:hypothetical protein